MPLANSFACVVQVPGKDNNGPSTKKPRLANDVQVSISSLTCIHTVRTCIHTLYVHACCSYMHAVATCVGSAQSHSHSHALLELTVTA